MDSEELLRSVPLFEGLAADDLKTLAQRTRARTLAAGEIVFQMGEVGSSMYVIAEGQVNIFLPGEASRRVSLKDLGRGEYFGELALFDEKPRSASALATTEVRLLELSRDTLADYLEQRPRAAVSILHVMSTRLRETNEMLSQRAARNVVEEIEQKLSWGDRLADRVANLNGSWAFIIGLMLLTGAWFVGNQNGLLQREAVDPYPFVFFNLLLAILVALQGPLIVMSQNRQVIKDRKTAEADFRVNLKNEVNIESILRELAEFRRESDLRLRTLERQGRPGA